MLWLCLGKEGVVIVRGERGARLIRISCAEGVLMLCRCAVAVLFASLATNPAAHAGECPGKDDALGTSRVIAIDPAEHRRLGSIQYPETLPLNDHEVVLTFDDGPVAPGTSKVLDALAAECVKATFFVVGQMAKEFPEIVQRAHREGHTIGTHTEHHAHLDKIAPAAAKQEIAAGIASTAKILGGLSAVAPFFRFPYLDETRAAEDYALKQGLMVWSVDFLVNDWIMTPGEISAFALERIEGKKKGILLLHDIQEKTALALPGLLRELKKRGYRVVHVVPADAAHPKTDTKADQWAAID
jgi:peptidoglycan-N-acetylglucosamine deacetylase